MASETIRMKVTGQDIIDAVKKIADKPVVNRDYVDGNDVFEIGQKSSYPYDHLVITVDDGQSINPKKTYEQMKVVEHNWGGMVYAIGYGKSSIINAVKKFAEALRNELADKVQAVEPGQAPIMFEFEGNTYQCSQSAYDKNKIVLPDGRVLLVDLWLESLPPKPNGLRVIDTLVVATKV